MNRAGTASRCDVRPSHSVPGDRAMASRRASTASSRIARTTSRVDAPLAKRGRLLIRETIVRYVDFDFGTHSSSIARSRGSIAKLRVHTLFSGTSPRLSPVRPRSHGHEYRAAIKSREASWARPPSHSRGTTSAPQHHARRARCRMNRRPTRRAVQGSDRKRNGVIARRARLPRASAPRFARALLASRRQPARPCSRPRSVNDLPRRLFDAGSGAHRPARIRLPGLSRATNRLQRRSCRFYLRSSCTVTLGSAYPALEHGRDDIVAATSPTSPVTRSLPNVLQPNAVATSLIQMPRARRDEWSSTDRKCGPRRRTTRRSVVLPPPSRFAKHMTAISSCRGAPASPWSFDPSNRRSWFQRVFCDDVRVLSTRRGEVTAVGESRCRCSLTTRRAGASGNSLVVCARVLSSGESARRHHQPTMRQALFDVYVSRAVLRYSRAGATAASRAASGARVRSPSSPYQSESARANVHLHLLQMRGHRMARVRRDARKVVRTFIHARVLVDGGTTEVHKHHRERYWGFQGLGGRPRGPLQGRARQQVSELGRGG